MRHTRWLFLAAIVAIIFVVGATYLKRRDLLSKEAPVHPKPLETGVDGRAQYWEHTVFKGDQKHFTIRARNFRSDQGALPGRTRWSGIATLPRER